MLMDSKKHAAFTGEEAKIDNTAGGAFTAYDNFIEGTTIELEPDKKIIQQWRAADWPEGHYSTAIFELSEKNGATTLHFTQENVPDTFAEDVADGWHEHYWEKMQSMLK